MDLVSLALAKKHSENIAAGVESFRVEGNTIYFTVKETQQELSVTVPTPADGVSITKVEIRKNNHLYCTLSNGKEIDAGKVESKGDGSVVIKIWDKVIEPGEDGSINLEIPGYNGLYFGEKENLSFVKYENMGEENFYNLPKEFWDKFDNFEENFPNSYIEEGEGYRAKIAPIGFEIHYKEQVGNPDIIIYNPNLIGADFKGTVSGTDMPTDADWAVVIEYMTLEESGEWVGQREIAFYISSDDSMNEIDNTQNMQGFAIDIDSIDVSLLYGRKYIIGEELLPNTISSLKGAIRINSNKNIFLGDAELSGDVDLNNNLFYKYRGHITNDNPSIQNFDSNVILGGEIQGYNTNNSFVTNSGKIGYPTQNDGRITTFCFAANEGEASGSFSTAFNHGIATNSSSFAANSGKANNTISAAFNEGIASAHCSFAIGISEATGHTGFSSGRYTAASNSASAVFGKYNAPMITGGNDTNKTGTVLAIGNGTYNYGKEVYSNAFSVQYDGTVAAAGTITASTTADYAENFEWFDENIKEEDRVGYFVTLEGNKIRKATPEDDYILGVVSGAPFVLGNGDCDVWNGLYIRDDYGRIIMEPTYEIIEEVDEKTGETIYTENKDVITGETPKVNPDYDPDLEYIPRRDRAEWAPVGMLGVLSVRQDGTLKVNGYAGVSEDGIATAAAKGYRVIEVLNNEVARIIFR